MIRQDQYIRQTSIKMKINQTLEIKRLRSFQIMLIIQYCEKVSLQIKLFTLTNYCF